MEEKKKLRSVTLTLQDVTTKDGVTLAAVFGTLAIDTGKVRLNEKTFHQEPVLESINFTTALANHPIFKEQINSLITEALTLKEMKIAQEEGLLSVLNKPVVKKRVSKTRIKRK
jgi:N-dimethylarginine dimethylaminohydrolase